MAKMFGQMPNMFQHYLDTVEQVGAATQAMFDQAFGTAGSAASKQHGMIAGHVDGVGGGRPYYLFVPTSYVPGKPAPLLLMLHGCQQTAPDFALGTGMNRIAEKLGWLVVYPEQTGKANHNQCWNWFLSANQKKGRGEPALLVSIVDIVAADYAVDRTRIFAAGLSAGGAMAATLGALYPDMFRAVGIHSGLPFGAATSIDDALSAMSRGPLEPTTAPTTPTIVFHGDRDNTVAQENAESISASWLRLTGDHEMEHVRPGRGHDYRLIRSSHGKGPVFEYWLVHGLGHAWSGGNADGSFVDAASPSASEAMSAFFQNCSRRDPVL